MLLPKCSLIGLCTELGRLSGSFPRSTIGIEFTPEVLGSTTVDDTVKNRDKKRTV